MKKRIGKIHGMPFVITLGKIYSYLLVFTREGNLLASEIAFSVRVKFTPHSFVLYGRASESLLF